MVIVSYRQAANLLFFLVSLACLTAACAPAPVYTVSGRVSGSWQCSNGASSRMPTNITLQPIERTVPFSSSGPEFSFEKVRDGEYTLVVSCLGVLGSQFPELPVTVVGADVDVDVILPFPTLPQHEPVATLIGHTDRVRSIAYATDGSVLISAAEDGKLIAWDLTTGELGQTWQHGHTDPDLPLLLSPDGAILASGARNGEVTLWDTETGNLLHTLPHSKGEVNTLPYSEGEVNGLAFSPDGRMLAAWKDGDSDQIVLWNVTTGQQHHSLDVGEAERVPRWSRKSILFLQSGAIMVSVMAVDWDSSEIVWWDVTTGGRLESQPLPSFAEFMIPIVVDTAVSPDESRIAFGMSTIDGMLGLWDMSTGHTASGEYEVGLGRVSFSPDGRLVASTAYDNTVVLWDAATGDPQTILTNGNRGVDVFAWSPDGETLAAGDGEGRILLWETP